MKKKVEVIPKIVIRDPYSVSIDKRWVFVKKENIVTLIVWIFVKK